MSNTGLDVQSENQSRSLCLAQHREPSDQAESMRFGR